MGQVLDHGVLSLSKQPRWIHTEGNYSTLPLSSAQSIVKQANFAAIMPHATKSANIKVVPLVHGKDKSGVKFGAEVYGVDLNDFFGMLIRLLVVNVLTGDRRGFQSN